MRAKRLGVAVAATAVMLMVGVAAAQAANFTAAKYPAFVSAEQVGPAGTGGGGGISPTIIGFESSLMAECEFAGFAGEMSGATSALTIGAGFFGCTAFGSAEGSIESNGCEFVFHPGTGSKDEYSGTFDIACPAGQKIVVSGGGCETQIGAQTGLGPVAYKNATALEPDAVEAAFQMKGTAGFSYTKTADTGTCPLAGTGSKTDGVIVGSIKIMAGDTETLEPFNLDIE
jgi:hypothetical protein